MTTFEDVRREGNVYYMPQRIPGPPPYWQRLLYAFGLVAATVVGVWFAVIVSFSFA